MMPQETETVVRPADMLFRVQLAFKRRGVETFVPCESWSKRAHRNTHRRVTTTKPLVPGLLFARLPEPVNWAAVMAAPNIRGVYGVVRPLMEAEIAQARAMEAMAVERPADPFALRPGSQAVMMRGPMAGQEMQLTDVLVDVPGPVAKGMVEMFGGKVEIVVPVENLRGVA